MYRRDYRDILGGALLLATGLFVVWYASATLSVGSFARMGPGFFPIAVGWLIAGFGIAVMVPAFFRQGGRVPIEVRSTLAVLSGVSAFALAIRSVGLVPAVVALLLLSSLAEPVFRPITLIAMAVILPLGAYLIFHVGLGVPFVMFRSPL